MNAKFTMYALLTLIVLSLGATAALSETTEKFHQSFTLKEGAPVQIENISGKVAISVWDQQTVDVQAITRAHDNSRDLERVSIDVENDGVLSIKTRYHRGGEKSSPFSRFFGSWGSGPNVSVDYTIRLPRAAALREVSTVSADILVNDLRGETYLHSVSGNIRLTNVAGPVSLKTTSGDVDMTGGTVKSVETISGAIRLRGISGDITVNSTSGDITVDGVSGMIGARSISGDISITGLRIGAMKTVSGDIAVSPSMLADATAFNTVSGDIRLRVPAGYNADVNMDTVSGELRTDGGVALKITQVSRGHITAKIGAGGKTLAVKTVSGDVNLEK